jgi:hypothetical protein
MDRYDVGRDNYGISDHISITVKIPLKQLSKMKKKKTMYIERKGIKRQKNKHLDRIVNFNR